MNMLTTKQAADILGISERRVRALAKNGALDAHKQGRDWLIDADDVMRRKKSPGAAGRPPASSAQDAAEYTLMNGRHEVCDMVVNRVSGIVLKMTSIDSRYAPPGACTQPNRIHKHYLSGWLHERMPQAARPDMSALLLGKGYKNVETYLLDNLALSLSDQYWLRPAGSNLRWRDVSLFSNRYIDFANPISREIRGYSPSTGGAQVKWWEQDDSLTSYLIKSGTRDSLAEYAASLMYKRLLDSEDYVSYELVTRGDALCSSCTNFIDEGNELVTMAHIMQCYAHGELDTYNGYAEICEKLGIGDVRVQLAKMLVCDYIIANRDRHTSNLGLVRNSESGEYLGVAPIFDNGQGFFRSANAAQDFKGTFFYISNPFLEVPERQLGLVEDWSWFDSALLDGFPDEAAALFANHGVFDDEAARAMADLLSRRIERAQEYASQMRAVYTMRGESRR